MLNIKETKIIKMQASAPYNDNYDEISFFDVKELYDAAYAEADNKDTHIFKIALMRAEKLANAYRAQLTTYQSTRYKMTA